MNEKISVLMCTYKEPVPFLDSALSSMLNQTLHPFEVVVVVDDPTNQLLLDYLQEKCLSHPEIKLHINDQNLGLVNSLNIGIGLCSGEYIARMDADDYSHKERLENQLAFLKGEGMDLVGANYSLMSENGDIIVKMKNPKDNADCKKTLKKRNCIGHPTWFGKTEVFRNLGGYREILACEDYDFLIRAVNAGYVLGNCQKDVFCYRYNREGISSTKKAKQVAITSYLRQLYRKGISPTMEQYHAFLLSEEFRRKVLQEEKYLEYKKDIRMKDGKKQLSGYINIVFSRQFWEQDFLRLIRKTK